MEITLDKKQIQVIFLFELKIDCKAMETTHNINNAFGPGTVTEHTLQPWFKKFCKGGKSLDGEEHSGWLSEVDDAQLRGSSKLILLQLHKKLPKTSTSTSLQLSGTWSKLERWKSSRSRYLMSWPQKKKIILKCHLLLFYTITTISQWNGFYTTTSNDQLSGWTEKKLQNTSQSQTCAQKRSWSLFSGLLPIWPTTAFWIPEKPLHLRCMLSELMRCTKNCKA